MGNRIKSLSGTLKATQDIAKQDNDEKQELARRMTERSEALNTAHREGATAQAEAKKLRQRNAEMAEKIESLSAKLEATERMVYQKISQKQDMVTQLNRQSKEFAETLTKCAALAKELEKHHG